jgi:hypothetical protein
MWMPVLQLSDSTLHSAALQLVCHSNAVPVAVCLSCTQAGVRVSGCCRALYVSAQAMRRNPFAPAVPCHRVVASDLDLGGFNGSWVSTAICAVQVAAAWQQQQQLRVRLVILILAGFTAAG